MNSKILITGPPRSGKSTLIKKILKYYENKERTLHGFVTPEVRKGNKRIGFNILNVYSKKIYKLARKENYDSAYNLGSYSVFIKEFEEMLDEFEEEPKRKEDIIIIDEIGKMELFSKRFQQIIRTLFKSSKTIIGTIGLNLKHKLKTELLNCPSIVVYHLTRKNQEEIFKKIINSNPSRN